MSSSAVAMLCVPNSAASCYPGPPATLGVGACHAGMAACSSDGSVLGPCVGDVVPVTESCSTPGDDNCDGRVNENCGTATPRWARSAGGPNNDAALAVAISPDDSVNLVGEVSGGAADVGCGPLSISASSTALVAARLAASGTCLWSRAAGSSAHGTGVAALFNGTTAVTGYFNGTLDFGCGPLTAAGGVSTVLALLDATGGCLWSKQFAQSQARAVSADATGVITITGELAGITDFGGGPLGAGSGPVFLASFDAAGNHQWSSQYGDGSGVQRGKAVAQDALGNVYVTGDFVGGLNLDGLTSAGGLDVFVAAFSNTGAPLWSRRMGNASDQVSAAVAADALGNVYLTGAFSGVLDAGGGPLVSAGGNDIFLVALSSSGLHRWSQRFGDGGEQQGMGVAVDPSGNVLLAGAMAGTVDFGGGHRISAGSTDAVWARFDPAGNHLVSRVFGNAQAQAAHAVASDSLGGTVLVGAFAGTLDGGGGVLAALGAADLFVASISF